MQRAQRVLPAGSGIADRPPAAWTDSPDALLLLLLGFALAVRLLTLPSVDAGGDALVRWHQAKLLLGLAPGSWEWSHHTARLGILFPVLAVQGAFGAHPALYYLAPLTFSLLQTALSFQLGVRIHGQPLGAALALLVVLFPEMRLAGTQLLPGVFSSTYVLAALLLLLRWRDDPAGRRRFLVASAVALYAAYLTKLPNAFFVPGFFAATWLWRRRPRDLVLYAGVLAAAVATETALYALATPYPLGRISMVLTANAPMAPLDSPLGLLGRYVALPLPWLLLLVAWAGATSWLLLEAARRRLDDRTLGLVLVPASFLLGLTVSVRSVDPLIPSQAFNSRYLVVALPLLGAVIGLAAIRLGRTAPWLRPQPATLLCMLLTLAVLGWSAATRGFDRHPLVTVWRYREDVDAFASGLPLIATDPRGLGARAWLMLYWGGPQPPVQVARDGRGGIWYAVAGPAEPLQSGEVLHARATRRPGSDGYDFAVERRWLELTPGEDGGASSPRRGGS